MANFFKDNEDLRFYVERGVAWGPLVELVEHGYTLPDGFRSLEEALQFYREELEMVGGFVADEIAPAAAAIDREGLRLVDGEVVFPPTLKRVFKGIDGLGLHGLGLPRELGGMNCPILLYQLNAELLARGDVSVMAHHGFHGGMAMAMLFFSVMEGSTVVDPATRLIRSTRFEGPIREIVQGRAWGCMDITEPDAGSDMAALRARGEQDAEGNWSVSGEKIFITSGHGKYHFVIARTEAAGRGDDPFAGLKGLSLFLVPTYEDGPGGRRRLARVDRLEEKLGHHGSATCTVVFDRTPAWLVGQRGEGFQQMLLLMNNARIGVAFEALGLCEAAWRLAEGYAAERRSMGRTIDRHELIADYLDEMRTDIQGIRALAVAGGYHEEMSQRVRTLEKYGAALPGRDPAALEREGARHRARARRLTPLAKYLAAEKAVEMARRAVQIHGGVGYTTEYGAEKLLRDAMVMPIYEGTSQIQALMAMKDTLAGIMRNPQGFVRRAAQARWRAVSSRDPLDRRVARLQVSSSAAQQHLITRTATDKLRTLGTRPLGEWMDALRGGWDPKRDFAYALLHAERLVRLLADEAVSELLAEQAAAHPDRREVLERWLERAEPRARMLHDEITTTGDRLIARLRGARLPEATSEPPAAARAAQGG